LVEATSTRRRGAESGRGLYLPAATAQFLGENRAVDRTEIERTDRQQVKEP
jgi:hypothetical protein